MRGGEPLAHLNLTPVHNWGWAFVRIQATALLIVAIGPAYHSVMVDGANLPWRSGGGQRSAEVTQPVPGPSTCQRGPQFLWE